ncbi:protein kinase [Anaeramoeba flamelloides]|uniref:Protein kinase n=1 Tax=Anaeramoeba flamelloides TaxID=1746091 RepID=A0AAV7YJS4_9EUKA|nr:protein kinase [Anaeramoeba flamelloides]
MSREIIGPYILGKTLGKGSFAKVKLATHNKTKQKVAIKIIQKEDISNSKNLLEKVRREIAVQRLMKHPNVLRIYDVYETSEHLFIILEYVSGGELFDYIVEKGSVPREEARIFFQQIIFAIEYCHSFLIAHRDLKPENLLLDEHKNVKVGDFGMAKIMAKNSLLETSCGSPHYASPEVIRGISYDGRKSDVWSCGVILYALLCGYLPFDDPNYSRLLNKVKSGRCKFPNKLLKNEKELIKRMLTVNPENRITIKEIKQHPWFRKNYPKGFVPPSPPVDFDVDLSQPIDSKKIEKKVFQNLIELDWGTKEEIIKALNSNERNAIKVFYTMFNKQTKKIKNETVKKRRRRGSLPPNAKISGKTRRRFSFSKKHPNKNKNNNGNCKNNNILANSFTESNITPMDLLVIQEVIEKTESNQEIDFNEYSEVFSKLEIFSKNNNNNNKESLPSLFKKGLINDNNSSIPSHQETKNEKEAENENKNENEEQNEEENDNIKNKQINKYIEGKNRKEIVKESIEIQDESKKEKIIKQKDEKNENENENDQDDNSNITIEEIEKSILKTNNKLHNNNNNNSDLLNESDSISDIGIGSDSDDGISVKNGSKTEIIDNGNGKNDDNNTVGNSNDNNEEKTENIGTNNDNIINVKKDYSELQTKKNKTGKPKRRWSFSRLKNEKPARRRSMDETAMRRKPRKRSSSQGSRLTKINSSNLSKRSITPTTNRLKIQKKSWFGKYLEKKKQTKINKKLQKKLIQLQATISESLQSSQEYQIDVRDDKMVVLSDKSVFEIMAQLQNGLTILNIQWKYTNLITLIGKGFNLKVKIRIKPNSMQKEIERKNRIEELNSNKKKKKKSKSKKNSKFNNYKPDLEHEMQIKSFKKYVVHFIWKDVEFSVAVVPSKQCSKILKDFQKKIPISKEFQFLKRVSKHEKKGYLKILLCPKNEISNYETILEEYQLEITTDNVPDFQPKTLEQYKRASEIWPINKNHFSNNQTMFNVLTENEEKIAYEHAYKIIDLSLKAKKNGKIANGIIVVNSKNNKVVFEASDTRDRSSDGCSPLLHPTMQAISQIGSLLVNYEKKNENKNENEKEKEIENENEKEKENENEKEIEIENENEMNISSEQYLCYDLDFYLAREPCVMCSMALVHSRVRRVFYYLPQSENGGIGSCFRLNVDPKLNHHFQVFNVKSDYLWDQFSSYIEN